MLHKVLALGCMLVFTGNILTADAFVLQWRIPLYDTMPSKMSGAVKYGFFGFIGIAGYMCYKALTFLNNFKEHVIAPQDKSILLQFICCAEHDLIALRSGVIQKLRVEKFALEGLSKASSLQVECMRQEFVQIAQQCRYDATSCALLESMCLRWRDAIEKSESIKQILIKQS